MKINKYFAMAILSFMTIAACTDKPLENDGTGNGTPGQDEGEVPEVNVPSNVSIDAASACITRTSLAANDALVWNPGDVIRLVVPSEFSEPFDLTLSTDITESAATATFSTTSWPNDKSASNYNEEALLFYPSTATYGEGGLGYTLATSQTAVVGSFGSNLMLSHAQILLKNMGGKVAVPENTSTVFTNVCGLLSFSLPESIGSIKSITVTSNNDSAPLAGTTEAFIQSYDANTGEVYFRPGTEWKTPSFSVTLTAEEGYMTPGNVYYIVVYPGVHEAGLNMTVVTDDNETLTLPNATPVKITHSKVHQLSMITEFTISEETMFVKRAGGEFEVALVSKNSWTADAPSWINLDKTAGGAGEYSFKFTISEPSETELSQWDMRAGCITISDGEETLALTIYHGYGTPLRGVLWADGNVGEPGTFVSSPEMVGGLYQFNSKVAITSDPGADISGLVWPGQQDMPGVETWAEENNPCPSGWRVPTIDELKTLVGGLDGTDVKSDWQWPDQTDFSVRGLMIGNTQDDALKARKDNMRGCVFVPASGFRDCSTGDIENDGGWGWLYGCRSYIQSCTRPGNTWGRLVLQIDEQNTVVADWAEVSSNYSAHPVRCVRNLPEVE